MVNRRRWRGFLPLPGVLLLAAGTAFAAPAWEEPGSPFRAEFEVLSQPDLPEAGVAVQVPACGLAAADGSDVRATDGRGRVLPVLPLGAGTDNSALVLVKPPADCPRVFCYFGSGVPAKKSPLDFKPGLTLDVRTMPAGRPPENRRELEKLLERSERIARLPVTEISQAGNPADLRGGYFLVFEGFLNVPKELAGTQTFMLVAAEAGWLQVRERVVEDLAKFHPGIKRFVNPHIYPVGLEESLFRMRSDLMLRLRNLRADGLFD